MHTAMTIILLMAVAIFGWMIFNILKVARKRGERR
jgi:hypothetical protein